MTTCTANDGPAAKCQYRGEPTVAEAFQARVQPWMLACFGAEISADRLERGDRLLEEVLELLQSGSYPPERVAALTGYVWSRPIGEPAQEAGGVMVTLAAYCLSHGLDMHEAGEMELARIWTKVEKIRAKQAAKPTGSALPQEWPTGAAPTVADDWNAAIRAAATICNRNYGKGIGEVHAAILALLRPEDHPADAGKPIAAPTVAEAARVLLDQPYSVMVRAFDAMDRMQGEGADRIMTAALRAIAGEGQP